MLVLIPSPDGIDLQKNLAYSVWTADTCHVATFVRTIAVENVWDGVLQKDYHNHLQNERVGGLDKELSSYLTNLLRSSLDEIDTTLRVKTLFSALARAYDKCFSLSAKYPKGFGYFFI